MKKKAFSGERKRSLFWIGLIVLIVMMGALAWQAKSLLYPTRPTPPPAQVRAKVPPAPPTTTIQITEPSTTASVEAQDTDESASPAGSADSQEPAPAEQTNLEAIDSDTGPEIPEADTSEPMIAVHQTPDENEQGPTGPITQPTEEKAETLTVAAKATAPAPDQGTTAESQLTPEPVPSQPTASKQVLSPEMDRGEPAPEQIDREPSPSTTPPAPAPYTIQIGAFRVKANAVETIDKLTQRGYECYIFEGADANRKPWYNVRFGHFETRNQAAQALSEFKKKEKMDGIICRSDAL